MVARGPAHHREGHKSLPLSLLAGDAVERWTPCAEEDLGARMASLQRRTDEQESRKLP